MNFVIELANFLWNIVDKKREKLFGMNIQNSIKKSSFKCKICSNKEFKFKSSLRSHMNFHKVKKPHACQFNGCKKRFASGGDLARHNLVHTKEQPYTCLVENCGRKFSRKCNLDRHNLVHTGEKPFPCQFCQFKTTQKQDLINHLKKKHNDKDLEKIISLMKPKAKSMVMDNNIVPFSKSL